MKTKFKLTPQAHKAILEAAKALPQLVKLLPDGKPMYRKLNTYEGPQVKTDGSYTKHTKLYQEVVYVNHEVEMRNAFAQYGESAVQKYIDMVHEINNATTAKAPEEKTTDLTKEEAIEALEKGKKLTHNLFSDDEFIYLKNGDIHDENGYNIQSEFWKWRTAEAFLTDWSIVE